MAKVLTNKRTQWAAQRNEPITFKGKRLVYNAGLQKKYVVKLVKLARQMTDETKRAVIKLFRGETAQEFFAQDANISSQARILTNKLMAKFESLFSSVAKDLATDLVDDSGKASASSLSSSLKEMSGGLTLKTNFMHDDLKTITKAAVTESVSLIKSIADDYLGKVQKTVMRSITTGNGLETLIPALQKYDGITERKAKNVALDQTRKIYNKVNAQRMEKVGLQKFEWIHSGGGQHPREEHVRMNGRIYNLDNPPVIDSNTGERGLPGQLPNCKCTMRPVYEFDGEENSDDADSDTDE